MVLDYVVKTEARSASSAKLKSKHKEKVFVVHRLDREVSGLLLFAKSEIVKKSLIENWTDNEKLYWALVEGKPQKASDTIKSYVMEGPKQKMIVVASSTFSHRNTVVERTRNAREIDSPKIPQLATLKYKTLSHHNDYTLLEIHLETGRKNQIRVQLSSMGCPIVGDRKYGADATYIRQIRLFAFSFSFKHPITKKRVTLSLPMPKTFLNVGHGDEKY